MRLKRFVYIQWKNFCMDHWFLCSAGLCSRVFFGRLVVRSCLIYPPFGFWSFLQLCHFLFKDQAMMKTMSGGNCNLNVPAKNSYRMVVLGASRVGKSSIVSRFLNGRFEDQYTPTIEDFHRKVYNIRGDMYQLDILDTSGNHPFPAMRRLSILTGEKARGKGIRIDVSLRSIAWRLLFFGR